MTVARATFGTIWASGPNLAAALLVALGIALVGWSYWTRPLLQPRPATHVATLPPVVLTQTPPATQFCDLPDIIVNLNNGAGARRTSFLKITGSLEFESGDGCATMDAKMTQIVDVIQKHLRTLQFSDLTGSVGLYRLREELLRRVNDVLAPMRVKDIYFKQILVQ